MHRVHLSPGAGVRARRGQPVAWTARLSRNTANRLLLFAGAAGLLHAQTVVDLTHQARLASGASLPALCAQGQIFFKSNAPAGANLFVCSSPNAWTQAGLLPLGGDASGSAPSVTVTGLQGRQMTSAAPSDQDALRWNASAGQWTPQPVVATGAGTPSPSCAAGALYVRNDTANNIHQLYFCSAANTWTIANLLAGPAASRPVNCVAGQTWLSLDTGAMTYCSVTGNPGTWSTTVAGPSGPAGPVGPQGPTGAAGTQGPAGAQGPQGVPGAAGSAGLSGNTVLSGPGAPSAATGASGDWYLNTTSSCLYGPKAGGSWPGGCASLIGPAGPQGAQGAQGPAGSQGPQGPAGPQGPQGPAGATGPAGPIAGSSGQLAYNNAGAAAGSNISQNADGSLTFGKALTQPICTVALSANPTFDASQCNTFTLALGSTAVASSVLTNAKAGQFLTFILTQDATGNRSFTWPGLVQHACTPSPTANAATIVTAVYDGVSANVIDCTTTDSPTVISGPERSEIAATSSGTGVFTFSTSAHTPVYYGNNSAVRHAVPRLAAGDQLLFSDLGGTATAAQLPSPGASSIGGVQSKSCSAGQHVASINTDGTVTCSNDSGSGGGTQTVASGSIALPTAALAGNTCSASAATATATGVLSTDAIAVAYASDPTGVTGYGGGAGGGISIRYWLSTDSLNVKLCNETGNAITPGSLSLTWRVTR